MVTIADQRQQPACAGESRRRDAGVTEDNVTTTMIPRMARICILVSQIDNLLQRCYDVIIKPFPLAGTRRRRIRARWSRCGFRSCRRSSETFLRQIHAGRLACSHGLRNGFWDFH